MASSELNQKLGDVKITLHWLDKSRSHRILWLFEELNVPYELKIWKRGKDMFAPKELKQVHPLGKSPVITIESTSGDGNTSSSASPPIVIAESGAIVEYIVDHFGHDKFVPKRWRDGREGKVGGETEEWLRYRQLMHYAEGSLMTLMMQALIILRIQTAPVPFFLKPITNGIANRVNTSYIWPNVKTHYDYLENLLATSPDNGEWFCGKQLTGADVLLSFPLLAGQGRLGPQTQEYPQVKAFVDRFQEREAYKRAVEKIEKLEGSFKATL